MVSRPVPPLILLLLACADPPPPDMAPHASSWKQEAELVVEGLESVEALWNEEQRAAAGTLAERVYTERFEPRIEVALREMEGPDATAQVEYQFGQLRFALEGRDRTKVEARIEALERRVRVIGDAAERAFPPPGQDVVAPSPPADVRPIVPKVPPAWELGDAELTEGGG